MKRLISIAVSIMTILGAFYLLCVHYTEAYQVAIVRDTFTGELTCENVGGFHLTPPWVRAARIDTRPIRVCISSSGRGYSCKLVQFEPNACKQFVAVEGFRYYWWANRISFNLGYDEEYRGMRDIMRGHAYGNQKYEFLRVIEEYAQ